jgi:FF domain
MKGVIEFDRREREKRERRERGEPSEEEEDSENERQRKELEELEAGEEESSDYTEVEATDDDENEEGEPSKRQRTADEPVEFNEDDLAYELEEMEGFDDNDNDNDEEPLTKEDCKILFSELLEDYKVNPYSTWDKVIEEDRIVEDQRYLALPNMKSRREAWDEWSKRRIQELKEAKEKQTKIDPKIPYFAFLQEHASAKLYWPEFKRKFRKEEAMKTSKMTDKDREKWYREYVKRLQLPTGTLKSDFTALLKSIPLLDLNRDTSIDSLPPTLLKDLRYASLASSIRDPLIETYISTLDSAPESSQQAEDQQSIVAKREARERREKALADRERRVEAAKHRQMKELRFGQARLREEERELERAMNVGRKGIKAQLRSLDKPDDAEETST